jgi:hypothetical protein
LLNLNGSSPSINVKSDNKKKTKKQYRFINIQRVTSSAGGDGHQERIINSQEELPPAMIGGHEVLLMGKKLKVLNK